MLTLVLAVSLAPALQATQASADSALVPVHHSAPASLPGSVRAVRRSAPITVDGRLDEPAWAEAPPVSRLIQRSPKEGAEATEPTQVRVL
jgi:hypothetical protein